MFRQDFIMRIIKTFINTLLKLVQQRREQSFAEARQTIEQAWEDIFGLPTASVMALSERTLLSMLLKQDTNTIDTALMVAWLFKEDGALAVLDKKEEEGRVLYLKALNCYLEIATDPTVSVEGFGWVSEDVLASTLVIGPHEAIEELRALLDDRVLPLSTMNLLFCYYEKFGAFAKAEDMLFYMLAAYPETPDLRISGQQFFERLMTLDDETLEAGDLPRSEVEEGLAQLAAK